jgi:hypothetical protein
MHVEMGLHLCIGLGNAHAMRGATAIQQKTTILHKEPPSPSQEIDAHIQHLNDWRGETLVRVQALIRQALPDVVEAVKWRGVPV